MTKRAEPNEHAQRLRERADALWDDGMCRAATDMRKAAAEIDRLHERILELEYYPSIIPEAKLSPAYVPTIPPKILGYDVLVEGRPVAVLKPEAVSAEIERLAARVRELEPSKPESSGMVTINNPSYEPWLAQQRAKEYMHRHWLPIADAPRDGTRVELWVNNHKAGYGAWHYDAFRSDSGEKYCNPTHWRPEPAGPESKPDQETKGER